MGVHVWPGSYEVWHEPPVLKTSLADGTRLRVSYYHAVTVNEDQAMLCPSEPFPGVMGVMYTTPSPAPQQRGNFCGSKLPCDEASSHFAKCEIWLGRKITGRKMGTRRQVRRRRFVPQSAFRHTRREGHRGLGSVAFAELVRP